MISFSEIFHFFCFALCKIQGLNMAFIPYDSGQIKLQLSASSNVLIIKSYLKSPFGHMQ